MPVSRNQSAPLIAGACPDFPSCATDRLGDRKRLKHPAVSRMNRPERTNLKSRKPRRARDAFNQKEIVRAGADVTASKGHRPAVTWGVFCGMVVRAGVEPAFCAPVGAYLSVRGLPGSPLNAP